MTTRRREDGAREAASGLASLHSLFTRLNAGSQALGIASRGAATLPGEASGFLVRRAV